MNDYLDKMKAKGKIDANGDPIWDPTDPDCPIKCAYPGCKNFPLWSCDPENSFLRNVTFDRVWEGCGKMVCEAHVVKMYNEGNTL